MSQTVRTDPMFIGPYEGRFGVEAIPQMTIVLTDQPIRLIVQTEDQV